jgi:hypothetical protein
MRLHTYIRESLLTILLQWWLANNTTAVIQKLLAKLLCSCICLALGGIASIDHKFHRLDEIGIGVVHDGEATCSDLMINGCEMAKENIVEYKDGILTNPIPGGVEMTSFECVENGLDAIHVTVTMFTTDAVQSSLKLH